MLTALETPEGDISLSKNIIGRIVIESVRKFRGKVKITNHKGKGPGIVKKISGVDAANNMDITMGEKGLDIRIYVVINFGTSIGKVTSQLIEEIQNRTKELTGLEPNSVAVIVTGMVSKQQMTRRNIEVKG